MDENQENTIERIALLERLDYTLKIVGIRGWMALLFSIALLIAIAIWSFTATLPLTISGPCIVFDPESILRVRSELVGSVSSLEKLPGDGISQGQTLLVVESNGGNEEIVSPQDGTVVFVNVEKGDAVAPGQLLVSIQLPLDPDRTTILGFFPLSSGEQIQEGMQARVSLNTLRSKGNELLKATVKRILPYPISPSDALLEKIPSASLRDYFAGSSAPTIAVVLTPLLDPANPSGLAWTSPKEHEEPLQQGAVGEVRVILEKRKPISFLFTKRAP